MIEAEMAGCAKLPSPRDLRAFITAADAVLGGSPPTITEKITPSEMLTTNSTYVKKARPGETPEDDQQLRKEDFTVESSITNCPKSPCAQEAEALVLPCTTAGSIAHSCTLLPCIKLEIQQASDGPVSADISNDDAQSPTSLAHAIIYQAAATPRAQPGLAVAASSGAQQRPRWADLSDSDHDLVVNDAPLASAQQCVSTQSNSRVTTHAPAKAQCNVCAQLLPRSAFSRRAWQQARKSVQMNSGGGNDGSNCGLGASCTACSAIDTHPAFDVLHRRERPDNRRTKALPRRGC